ncbi:MAG: hypothetical protein WDA29_10395 [Flavobacteriaceae bacterium]|jgi:hypothetical protein|nr:hypothetical protein [Candidatus Kapabacteria bacterium]
MKALVTKEDLDEYKYIADSVKNRQTWEQMVNEAVLLDVKNWLGESLLAEIIEQNEKIPVEFSAENKLLLSGGRYEYNKRTYMFQGLKAAIIYYAFARFTNRMQVNYTALGLVIKESDYSNPVSDKTVQRLVTEAKLTADAIRDEISLFLNRNCRDYPLWRTRFVGDHRTRTFKVLGE